MAQSVPKMGHDWKVAAALVVLNLSFLSDNLLVKQKEISLFIYLLFY